MKRTNWIAGLFLSLLLIGGFALDVSAQQPAAPTAPAETPQTPDSAAPAVGFRGIRLAPPLSTTPRSKLVPRGERVIERPATFLGVTRRCDGPRRGAGDRGRHRHRGDEPPGR